MCYIILILQSISFSQGVDVVGRLRPTFPAVVVEWCLPHPTKPASQGPFEDSEGDKPDVDVNVDNLRA